MKLKKRPDAIIKLASEAVAHLPEATAAFHDFVAAEPSARPPLMARLSKIEEAADESYLKLVRKIADTFITPYDREDLYNMCEALDDAIDALDHAGRLVLGFEMERLPQTFVDSAVELMAMSDEAAEAVGNIKKPKKLEKNLYALNKHENKLDFAYRELLCETLVEGADPIAAMRLMVLADLVEQAATQIDEFTRTLAVAAIKET